jgi:hypothetical protein
VARSWKKELQNGSESRIVSIFAGFCPLVKILGRFGYDKSKCCTPGKDGKSYC